MFYADAILLKPPVFKRLTGVSPETFRAMAAALGEHLPGGGRPARHCREDRLLLTLMYWREYRTYAHIAQTYGLSEAAVCRTVHTVEDALLRSGAFTLPGKKVLARGDIVFGVVVVDATECPVERPQKSRSAPTAARRSATPESAGRRRPPDRAHPSHGVQRGQDARLQAMHNFKLCTTSSYAQLQAMHNFKLLQRSRLAIRPATACLADSGYQGLKKRRANSCLPARKSKLRPLTGGQRANNRQLSRERFAIEHIIRSVKIFRILAERYRNRRKRFNLIAALYNLGRPT